MDFRPSILVPNFISVLLFGILICSQWADEHWLCLLRIYYVITFFFLFPAFHGWNWRIFNSYWYSAEIESWKLISFGAGCQLNESFPFLNIIPILTVNLSLSLKNITADALPIFTLKILGFILKSVFLFICLFFPPLISS